VKLCGGKTGFIFSSFFRGWGLEMDGGTRHQFFEKKNMKNK
jgi:hypothetical protein